MDVLLTGAFGQVGTAVLDSLGSDDAYEFTCLDRAEPETGRAEGASIVQADVADYDAIRPAFNQKDAVVHLAAAPKPHDPWEDVLQSNIIGTYNVLEAAADAGVGTVVFASSHHVMGGYEDEFKPALYDLIPTTGSRSSSESTSVSIMWSTRRHRRSSTGSASRTWAPPSGTTRGGGPSVPSQLVTSSAGLPRIDSVSPAT